MAEQTVKDGGVDIDEIVSVVGGLCKVDPATLDHDDLVAALSGFRRVIGWAQAGMLACTRRQNSLATAGHGQDASLLLATHGGQSTKDAADIVEQSELCNQRPELEASLAEGAITAAYLNLIARYRRRLNDVERSDFDQQIDRIHEWARSSTVTSFEIRLKQLVKHISACHRPADAADELDKQRRNSHIKSWVDQVSGMHHHMLVMDPIRSSKFTTAIQAELAALRSGTPNKTQSFGSIQIEALINAVSGGNSSQRSSELIVVVDHGTLTSGQHADTICETIDGHELPVEHVRGLCGDATLTLVAMNEQGGIHQAIDERVANRAQRRALAALYRTCAYPGCETPFSQTRMHHVEYYNNGGRTELGNLIPLCERHHHRIHDQGWTICLDPTSRTATFTPPHSDRGHTTHPDRPNRSAAEVPTPRRSIPRHRPGRHGDAATRSSAARDEGDSHQPPFPADACRLF